jgi:hypothetical protein
MSAVRLTLGTVYLRGKWQFPPAPLRCALTCEHSAYALTRGSMTFGSGPNHGDEIDKRARPQITGRMHAI